MEIISSNSQYVRSHQINPFTQILINKNPSHASPHVTLDFNFQIELDSIQTIIKAVFVQGRCRGKRQEMLLRFNYLWIVVFGATSLVAEKQ